MNFTCLRATSDVEPTSEAPVGSFQCFAFTPRNNTEVTSEFSCGSDKTKPISNAEDLTVRAFRRMLISEGVNHGSDVVRILVEPIGNQATNKFWPCGSVQSLGGILDSFGQSLRIIGGPAVECAESSAGISGNIDKSNLLTGAGSLMALYEFVGQPKFAGRKHHHSPRQRLTEGAVALRPAFSGSTS